MKTKCFFSFAALGAAIIFVGLLSANAADETAKAIASLSATSGSSVGGSVTFTSGADGVTVVADITGLKPGKHGFHIHEFGDCTSADGKAAGGHFNPMHHEHAGPDAANRHMGDLGNIEADASGKAHLELNDKTLKLDGPNSIIGHAVIVHEKVDDLKTQPTGDAGGRLACGVIGVAKK